MRVRRKWSGQLVPIVQRSSAHFELANASASSDGIEVADRPPARRSGAAQVGQDRRRRRLAIDRRRRHGDAAELRPAGALLVLVDELAHLLDGHQAAEVGLALRLAPREEAVAAENQAVGIRLRFDRAAEHQRQLEPGPLPRHPDDLAAVLLVELLDLLLAVGARGQRDRPVGMQVIDVVVRQKRVQRGVDRRRDAVVAEGAERVVPDHLVFVRFAAVAIDERLELVHVEHGKAGRLDRPQVAAAALDRQHARRLAR